MKQSVVILRHISIHLFLDYLFHFFVYKTFKHFNWLFCFKWFNNNILCSTYTLWHFTDRCKKIISYWNFCNYFTVTFFATSLSNLTKSNFFSVAKFGYAEASTHWFTETITVSPKQEMHLSLNYTIIFHHLSLSDSQINSQK